MAASLIAGPNGAGAPAVLVLEDGTTFGGTAFGADGETFGEMVFNTGMTGYQETLTDPSYARQIVAMTAPHIGNTGINDEDPESRRIWVSGYVVREPARLASNWRSRRSLDDELRAQGITGIAITGTRALTRHLRDRGAMRAGIATGTADSGALRERVLASPQMVGADLAREVSTQAAYTVSPPDGTAVRYRVAAVDLGIKTATPLAMARRGCQVTVLPAASTTADILAPGPDGVFFSNGPGDPAASGYAVDAVRGVLAQRRAGLRHLPGQPGPGPGARPGHLQAPLRPPRGEPAGQGPGLRAGADHQPQPRLRGRHAGRRRGAGRQRRSAPTSARPRSPTSTSTTAWSRACGCWTGPRSASSTTPRPRRARTMRPDCLRNSATLMDGARGGGHAQA